MFIKNGLENEDPMWKIHMKTLIKRKKNMEIAQIIDDVIKEWYSEKGLPVPQWKQNTNPQWWVDYLKTLNMDSKNP